eukprot:TRINITY_DN490_c0_g1_i11.p1 TRINITY_DN490_c0_g1~~TRINITY_DN490_c0_g1_i11.p1  ORF type:complete len:503 (-),score=169.66 TRINITY_DN490_c0_g1_i11:381-1889(-)
MAHAQDRLLLVGASLVIALLALTGLNRWIVLAFALVASLPFWLPQQVIRLRFWLFARINGPEGLQLPNETFGPETFKWLYGQPAVRLRSIQRGVGLSDLFWYLLAPAHDIHQEHCETGTPLYASVASATRKVLSPNTSEQLTALANKYAERMFSEQTADGWRVVRLRDMYFPMFEKMFYELLFKEEMPEGLEKLYVGSADNVITALKGSTLRDMPLRDRLTAHLEDKLKAGACKGIFDDVLTLREKALHLQGVFFHTGCVQISEAAAHLTLAIAQHPAVQKRLQTADESGEYLDMVIAEALRVWPLFGVAHRITSEDVVTPEGITLPGGTVCCFNYPKFHHIGFDNPDSFVPERWGDGPSARRAASAPGGTNGDMNYIPFGMKVNRPCPAQHISMVWLREVARVAVKRASFHSAVDHVRSMPDRGLAIVEGQSTPLPWWKRSTLLAWLALQDHVEGLGRSFVHLVLVTYMLWDSRRKALAYNYWQKHKDESVAPAWLKADSR